jgi:hypothetical protein
MNPGDARRIHAKELSPDVGLFGKAGPPGLMPPDASNCRHGPEQTVDTDRPPCESKQFLGPRIN